mgnify:CR=1 FL=1
MNYAEIKYNDIANGPGVRTSLFVSGCTHRCKGCFNEVAWDFNYGTPFTQETIDAIINSMKPAYIAGITLLGGEPFEPQNQRALLPFLKKVRERFPKKNIWCYTGYLFDKELLGESRARCECTDEMLSLIDVLVDGEFVQELYSVALAFRGSENQRIIDVKKSLETGEIVWHALMSRGISMKFN